jgi:hypothetical protein
MIRLHDTGVAGRSKFTSAPFTYGGTVYINHNLNTDCVKVYLFTHSNGSSSFGIPEDYWRNDYWTVNHYGWQSFTNDFNTVGITFQRTYSTTQVIADVFAEEPYPR